MLVCLNLGRVNVKKLGRGRCWLVTSNPKNVAAGEKGLVRGAKRMAPKKKNNKALAASTCAPSVVGMAENTPSVVGSTMADNTPSVVGSTLADNTPSVVGSTMADDLNLLAVVAEPYFVVRAQVTQTEATGTGVFEIETRQKIDAFVSQVTLGIRQKIKQQIDVFLSEADGFFQKEPLSPTNDFQVSGLMTPPSLTPRSLNHMHSLAGSPF